MYKVDIVYICQMDFNNNGLIVKLYALEKIWIFLANWLNFWWPNKARCASEFRIELGAVHKRRHQSRGEGGFAKRWSYLISLFSKNDDEGGKGSKIFKKWWRLLWTAPYLEYFNVCNVD